MESARPLLVASYSPAGARKPLQCSNYVAASSRIWKGKCDEYVTARKFGVFKRCRDNVDVIIRYTLQLFRNSTLPTQLDSN